MNHFEHFLFSNMDQTNLLETKQADFKSENEVFETLLLKILLKTINK